MAPIKVGLMGYGFSTKCFHLPFITPNPDLEVCAFLQRKEPSEAGSWGHCTKDYPDAKWHRTEDEFFADSNIELVIVCTGSKIHTQHAEKALKAGKHVVVEKPFTVSSAEADHLIALAKQEKKVLTVFQNRRYDSDFRTLQHLMQQGAFGTVTEFENHYDTDQPEWVLKWDKPGYEAGEGMLYGLGTHSIDQTLLLFGPPKSVTAWWRATRMESQTDDAFTVILQYGGDKKNLVCTVKTTIVTPLPMSKIPKFIIRGTEGAFIKNGEDPQIDHLFAGMKVDDPKFGVEPESYHGYVASKKQLDAGDLSKEGGSPSAPYHGVYPSQKGSYLDYYKDVVKAIRGEAEVAVKPEQSRDGIRVIELARESAEKGVTVEFN
ncbi:hypothetical protein BAUCODRAFT_69711 [Baudoinia panamericana UAMH 10762]|uniref:Gfo/Idh/MocA-like oxidoreductase N-terminal domain-containing protein n=1 Tax=Baudoinia panamericana (strain UAMH 10762) TaxID=717646 RepID=M2MHZ2_BAUPA|nr:uncharacterized protein BAUCODRAFT_69711 [Baudoinia panamericana UAMH 10762]EMC96261.1 hypothetical protein BAUCODRAFT_69711 [Baudoinia panamericana UAMH 10762]